MKTSLFKIMGAGLLMGLGLSASAQCLNVNGDMETQTAPITSGNAWINNHLTNWNVSHGTPSIGSTPTTNMWMWSYSGNGEGVYTDFNFVAGETYELCYDLWRDGTSNPSSVFRVELSNSLSPSTSGFAVPTPAGNQSLGTQSWTSTGTWVTITETFTATSNFSQLWFYPYLAGLPDPWQAAARIDNVCIKNVVTDPCEFEPVFEIASEDCTTYFTNASGIPAGLTVLDVSWDFGDGNTANGNSVSHVYTMGGTYDVCMTVWTINEDGECCQRTFCERIEVEGCDPCELLERIDIVATGSNPITFDVVGLPAGLGNIYGYHWDFGDGNTGVGSPITHTYTRGGGYVVCLTVYYYDEETRSCCSQRFCIEVEAGDIAFEEGPGPGYEEGRSPEGNTSVETATSSNIVLAPNPSNGQFEVFSKDGMAINTASVYTQDGKLAGHYINASNTNRFLVDASSLDTGIYLVIINETDEMNRSFQKIVID